MDRPDEAIKLLGEAITFSQKTGTWYRYGQLVEFPANPDPVKVTFDQCCGTGTVGTASGT